MSDYDRQTMLQALAYQSWLQRGHPIGSPDIDWAIAEQHLAIQDTVVMAFSSDRSPHLSAKPEKEPPNN